jgi:hypothetical protein
MVLARRRLPADRTREGTNVITQRVRLGVTAGIVGSLMVMAGACGGATTETGGGNASTTTPVTAKSSPVTTEQIGDTGGTPGTDKPTITIKPGGTTTTVKSTPTTSKKVLGPEFVGAAAAAFQADLGDFKALEMTIHPDQPRATVQVQDPTKPANVDEYEFTGAKVGKPAPVTITGDGDLEANLFQASTIAWDQIPAMMEQAVAEIGPLEGSTGVTHLIIQKNLPFDEDTVINIYVDGGSRSQGGYVSFLNDGTLKKVYGP